MMIEICIFKIITQNYHFLVWDLKSFILFHTIYLFFFSDPFPFSKVAFVFDQLMIYLGQKL